MNNIKSGTRLEKRIYVTTQPTLLKRTCYHVLPACVVSVLQMYNIAVNCFARNNFTPSLFIIELPKFHNA